MSTRYTDARTATAKSDGTATFVFEQPPSDQVISGTVTVTNAESAASWSATVGGVGAGRSWGTWNGIEASQPVQMLTGEVLTVKGTGLVSGKLYSAEIVGVAYDVTSDYVPYLSPAQPNSALPGTRTALSLSKVLTMDGSADPFPSAALVLGLIVYAPSTNAGTIAVDTVANLGSTSAFLEAGMGIVLPPPASGNASGYAAKGTSGDKLCLWGA